MNETDLLQTAVKTFYLTRPSFLHVDLILIDATFEISCCCQELLFRWRRLPSGCLSDRALIVWTDSFGGSRWASQPWPKDPEAGVS